MHDTLLFRRFIPWVLLALVVALLCGCGPKTTVVLLPEQDGKVGRLTVTNDSGQVEIARPGEATVISPGTAPSSPVIYSQEKIRQTFGETLAVLPDPPIHFVLYFQSESTTLTAESQAQLHKIFQTISQRQSEDIGVIGHTDTTGNKKYNMILSRKRAEAVSQILVEHNISRQYLRVTSHGEENPLIKTADNVPEPKNRRVEVVVR